MRSSELLARIVITMAIFGVIGTPLFFWAHTPLIHARLAENGGWSPDVLHGRVGEPLVLHLTSDDVTHGFASRGDAHAKRGRFARQSDRNHFSL